MAKFKRILLKLSGESLMGNFKRLGVQSRPLDGRDRLAALHGQLHPGSREPFRFAWKDIPRTGMGTKDFIAPDSFDFRQSRTFRVGQSWGAASYLQILASEMSDKLLALVGIGTYFFVYGGTVNGAMEKLLEEGDYTRDEKSTICWHQDSSSEWG